MANLIAMRFNIATPYEAGRQYLFNFLHDNAWAGKRCFIVGGGPSLSKFNFESLRGEKVIAINRAFQHVHFADIMFSIDPRFYKWCIDGNVGKDDAERRRNTRLWNEFVGYKVWLDTNSQARKDIYLLPYAGSDVQYESAKRINMIDGLISGNFAGYAAINLAFCLGANPIYLLGYDCKWDGKKTHYHSGYEATAGEMALKQLAINMMKLREKANHLGRKVINLNPDSAIKCFHFGNVDSILHEKKNIERPKKYVLISFYTKGTSYENEITKLKNSLFKFGIRHHFFECEPLGSWRKNLNYKSACILKSFEMFPKKDIVFVDSDAIVRKSPILFNELSEKGNFDIAAHFHNYIGYSAPGGSLLSGTLWFKNNPKNKELVARWHEIGFAHLQIRHQHCLNLAIKEFERKGKGPRVFRMPREYTYIFDYYPSGKFEPVIEHFQASRKFKREVGVGERLLDSNFLSLGQIGIRSNA